MKIFITGMAGTLGTAIAVEHFKRGDEVVGCSRNELNCLRWREANPDLGRVFVFDAIGLRSSDLKGYDKLYHCAALKHIDVCEQQPLEAMRQNVALTLSVVDACQKSGTKLVLASTDKACRADSVYGATKLLAERIVLAAGGTVVRLGNLIGSSGSVFQRWREQADRGEPITLTDPEMTRWFLPVREAAEYMVSIRGGASTRSWPGSMKSAKLGDVALAIARSHDKIKVVGPRPGETRHQWITDDASSEHAERWDIDELMKEAYDG